jgi:hypothetical protein
MKLKQSIPHNLFICGLVNDTTNSMDDIVLNDMINKELARKCKKAVLAETEVLPWNLPLDFTKEQKTATTTATHQTEM